MNDIVWNDKCIGYILDTVEYDLVRYNHNDFFYKSLLELHKNKFNSFIMKGRYKSQKEFEKALFNYRNLFKEMAIPDYLVY